MTSIQYKLAELFIKANKIREALIEENLPKLRSKDVQKPIPFPYFSVKYRHQKINGTDCYTFTPPKVSSDEVIVYLHGGAFCFGPQVFHWIFVKKLALDTQRKVLFINYPKSPEHPYPAAIDACTKIIEKIKEPFILMGDSAGGTLSLVISLKLRDEQKKMPTKIVALAPCIECTFSNPEIDKIGEKDVMLHKESLQFIAKDWYASGRDIIKHPYLSPIYAETLKGLPPIFLQVGSHDLLYPDCIAFYKKATKEGHDITLDVGEKMGHDWMIAPEIIPEAKKAMKKMVDFVNN